MSARRLPRTWRDTALDALGVPAVVLFAAVAVGGVALGEPLLTALAVALGAVVLLTRRCSQLRLTVTDRTLDAAHVRRQLADCEAELADAYDEMGRPDTTGGLR